MKMNKLKLIPEICCYIAAAIGIMCATTIIIVTTIEVCLEV